MFNARLPRDPAHLWRDLASLARGRAAAAQAGEGYRKDQHEVAFCGAAIRTPKLAFPIDDAPAQGVAASFAMLVRTFTATTNLQRRQLMAPALEALAVALDTLLDEPALKAAANARRMQGEAE